MASDVDMLVLGAMLLLKGEVTKTNTLVALAILASGSSHGSSHETAGVGSLGELLGVVLPPKLEQPLLRAPLFLRLPNIPLPRPEY